MTDLEHPDALVIESDAPEADEAAPRKKRRKGTSPTARTLAECRRRGWPAGVVEKFVRFPPPGHHVDLFGVIDIVAIVTDFAQGTRWDAEGRQHDIRPPGVATIGIQACAGGNGDHSRRRAKILAEPRARQWVEAGNRLELWSWSKRGDAGRRKLWTLRVEVFARESWAPPIAKGCPIAHHANDCDCEGAAGDR